jgi:C1A family cysteine protease
LQEPPEWTAVVETGAVSPPRGHGLVPYEPDERDLLHPFPKDRATPPEPRVDLSAAPEMPEVWDQGSLDSCVPHAVAAAWEFAARKAGEAVGTPSRLFIWYEGRALEGSAAAADVGIMIRTALKVLFAEGAPPEELWRYVAEKFSVKPPERAYDAAKRHKAQNYFLVKPALNQTLVDRLKAVLADGFPICFSFQYFDSFESADFSGEVSMPGPDQDAAGPGGGHAALLVGYDDTANVFKARNSYGQTWGQHGYFTLPYDYVSAWAGPDFWTLRHAI